MKIIINTRGSGKAKQLLEAASKVENAVILTQDKRAFEVKMKSYGYYGIKVIDYNDLKEDNYPFDGIVFIHNGDKLLSYLLDNYYGLKLGGFTATMEKN